MLKTKRRSEILRNDGLSKPFPFEMDSIHCCDSVEALKLIPDASVHLILSDIPYGIGIEKWDVLHDNTNSAYMGSSPGQVKAGAVFKHRGKPINGWSDADREIPKAYYDWCSTWASEWLRILKPGGSAFVFAGRRYGHRCVSALEDAGFNYRDMLGWSRERAVYRAQRLSIVFERRKEANLANDWEGWRIGNLRPSFEPIIWCFKPYRITIADNVIDNGVGAYNEDALLRYFGRTDNLIECSFSQGEGGLHPAQKPLKLMSALIELVTCPGHIVVDPFCGSGSTLLAAKNLIRHYIGFDMNESYVQTASARLTPTLF